MPSITPSPRWPWIMLAARTIILFIAFQVLFAATLLTVMTQDQLISGP